MPLTHAQLLQLTRWNTPTIYNGWEQLTRHDPARTGINPEPTTDFMPELAPLAGYAVTLVVEPSNPRHKSPQAWRDYLTYVAEQPGPKIVVVQDLERGETGSFWGEVNANTHRALGCVGTITDGAIRDRDEMQTAGFKALARRLCVGHAHVCPVRWGGPVTVFGRQIFPGQLVHADKHGFLAVPDEDQDGLLEAAIFMDTNECNTVIAAAREAIGLGKDEALAKIFAAQDAFRAAARARFAREGEF